MKIAALLLMGIVVYLGLNLEVLNKPLTIGYIQDAYQAKQRYADSLAGRPKIIVVGGSSSLFSVRCQLIERALATPCVNMAVTAGIGIDLILDKALAVVGPGDRVILPLEYDFYAASAQDIRENATANAYLATYDHPLLVRQAPPRLMAALFSLSLPDLYSSVVEMALQRVGFQRRFHVDQLTEQGDMSGHSSQLAAPYADYLATLPAQAPVVDTDSAGAELIVGFVEKVTAKGAKAYGTFPASIDDGNPPAPGFAQVEGFWRRAGAGFLRLPNLGRYPRDRFFDTSYHLAEPAQIEHSRMLAESLGMTKE